MKAMVFSRNKVVKIRYDDADNLTSLLDALLTVPGLEVIDRGYKG